MKTRRETCVFILLMLVAGVLFGADANNPTITGEWQGMVATQHLIVRIEQAGDGSYTGKLTAVDQGNVTVPVEAVSYAAGVLRIELKSNGAFYEATLSADGNEFAGAWHQGGNTVPLTLRRPGAAAPKLTLKPRSIGSIPFEPCRTADGNTEGLCGKYVVYENRALKSGRTIALNIMVLPALSEKPAGDPWFPLGGGPGQSAVTAYPAAGFTTSVRQQRDVVLVDQRGTGGSNPLPCNLRDPKDPQELIGDAMPVDRVRACRAELEKKADLTQYTTSISADDLDDVRQAMGYDKVNVFGASYGTLAGLVYLRRHGDHVRTLTLEAVATPNYRIPLPFARTIQSSIDGLIDRCAADAACNKDYPDLKKEFRAVVDRLDRSPAHFEVKNAAGESKTVTLSRGMFVGDLRPVLYIPTLVRQFPDLVHRAYHDDWSVFAGVATGIRAALDKAVDRGMSLSVICAEALPGMTESMIRRETAGTYLGDYQVRIYQKACHEWARGSIPRDFYDPIHSAVPTLLISGALDPATPPEASAQAARDLINSRVVVVKNGTHGTGSPCIDRLISEFVSQGSATGLDASCADQISLPFVTSAQR